MPDGHIGPVRKIREVFGELVVERELVLLGQFQDRGGGELFGYGADAEFGVWSDWRFLPDVGQPEAALKDDVSIAGHEDGNA